jgi:hypothetical protein
VGNSTARVLRLFFVYEKPPFDWYEVKRILSIYFLTFSLNFLLRDTSLKIKLKKEDFLIGSSAN